MRIQKEHINTQYLIKDPRGEAVTCPCRRVTPRVTMGEAQRKERIDGLGESERIQSGCEVSFILCYFSNRFL
jgi:hypothetical protein